MTTTEKRGATPRWAGLLYAEGAFGFNVLHQMQTLWLVYFYAPPPESGRPVLAPIALLTLLFAVGRVVEAFDDLLIGHWSDVTRSRWGRRLPFIVGGGPFVGVLFILLWFPPPLEPVWMAIYVFLVLQAYFLAATVVQQPYEAVLAEMSRDSATRVRVATWKVAFGIVGAAVGLIGSGLLIERIGFGPTGAVFAAIAVGSVLLSVTGIRRLPRAPALEKRISLPRALLLTTTNRQFLVFVTSSVLFFLGLNLLTLLLPYFATVVLRRNEGLVSLLTATFTAVAFLSLPLVGRLAAWRSKAFAYKAAMAALGLLLPGLFFIGYLPGIDPLMQGFFYVALLGVPMAALFVLPSPLIADIIDDDARRTGLRREGMYYAADVTVRKLGFALSTAIFGAVLATFGFSVEQPLGVRLIGPIAGLGVLLGLLLFAVGYRLPDRIDPDPVK
ncbi:MAG: MFS transporter [Chloroflexota bacterium]|nr:MFS transporter [Dehalococcoidia bacterium]MDW8252856.1 MFS transporter [Chloroflexota bacterium]